MTTKSKDPGIWHYISASREIPQREAKKAAERLVARSFVESRYGAKGVSSLDSVPSNDQGEEVPPDILIVETSGSRLGIELVRATRPHALFHWSASENNCAVEDWVKCISELIGDKKADLKRWSVNCDRRGLLIYSDAESFCSQAMDVVADFKLNCSEFDEAWLLLSWIANPTTGELLQPALFDLRTGVLTS